MKHIRRLGLPFSVLSVLALSSCLVSGTFVILLAISFSAQVTQGFNKEDVDLNDNTTYADHNEDIKRISNILFEILYDNNSGSDLTGEIWLVPDGSLTDRTDVRNAAGAVEILGGLTLTQGSDNMITFEESAAYRENIQAGLDFIDQYPQFTVYAFPDDSITLPVAFTIQQIRLMITLDAGQAN